MGTLSTNASSSAGPDFDEMHVNCALEILRIAGMFKRNLRSFEHSVRDRLRALSNAMADAVLEGSDDGGGDDDDDAALPDELSPVQIRAMLAREACDPTPTYVDDGTGVKCPTSVVQLRRLAGGGGGAAKSEPSSAAHLLPLFPRAHESTSRLARGCLSLVFEVCSAIPERQLRGISALPIWKKDGGKGGSDGDEESYGILPQQYITQVGEHMLALVQALEPFASDPDSLGLANEVMSGVMEVAVQPWKEFVAAAGCSFAGDGKSQLEVLMRGGDLSGFFLDDGGDDDRESLETKKTEEEDEGEEAAFCNQWLDVVGMAVTGRLFERTMRIPRLGRRGAEHLATDLNYIMNVFTALGVPSHPHPLLKYITQLVMMEDQIIRSKIQLHREETSEAFEVIKRAELRIAYVRGIPA